jgi:hypothetical protein
MLLSTGAASQVYSSAGLIADVPPGAVTVMSSVPGTPPGAAGAIAVMESFDATKLRAGVVPKWTAVVVSRPVPEMTTLVPAVSGPEIGKTPVTTGIGKMVIVTVASLETCPSVSLTV